MWVLGHIILGVPQGPVYKFAPMTFASAQIEVDAATSKSGSTLPAGLGTSVDMLLGDFETSSPICVPIRDVD